MPMTVRHPFVLVLPFILLAAGGSAQVAQPAPAAVAPAVPTVTEAVAVQSPLPTVAPAFGNVLDFAGDRLVVTGAVLPRQPGSDGQIATFERQVDGTWSSSPQMPQVARLAPGDFALQRLAANGDTLATSVTRRQGSGEVAWFARTEGPERWRQMGSIMAPAGRRSINFGGALAMSGDLLAVGEVSVRPNMKEEDYLACPKVYLFRRSESGWEPQGALQRDEAKKPHWFGCTIAFDADTLAVGNPTALKPFRSEQTFASLEQPMVCVYRRDDAGGWKLEQEVGPLGGPQALGAQSLGFGNRVALKGDLLVVQSIQPFDEGANNHVLVYRRSEGRWNLEGRLEAGAGVRTGRGFGFALAIAGDAVLVGDVTAVEGEDASGRVFVFRRRDGAWTEVARLKPSVRCTPRSFGSSIATHPEWVAVGHVRSEQAGIEPGGALLFPVSSFAASP